MHPIVSVGPLEMHTFGLVLVLAFVVALAFAEGRGRRRGLPPGSMLSCAAFVLAGAWLGARLVPIVVEPHAAFSSWERAVRGLAFTGGAWYGAFAGGVAGLAIFCRRRGLPVRLSLDVAAPAIALGQALGRVGCFLAGCDHGRPSADLSWGVVYTDPRSLVPAPFRGVSLHPTQIYEALGCLVILAAVLGVERRLARRGTPRAGVSFAAYAAMYAVLRFSVEFYRGDVDRGLWIGGALSTSQIVSLCILLLLGLLWLVHRGRDRAKPDLPSFRAARPLPVVRVRHGR